MPSRLSGHLGLLENILSPKLFLGKIVDFDWKIINIKPIITRIMGMPRRIGPLCLINLMMA
jgi:hypothetical protein